MKSQITIILGAISVVGMIGIPMGDPKFLANAITLEAAFVALTLISVWRPRLVFIPSTIIATIVIIGNTVSPRHIEIMTSFAPLENALVLIVGGYILQGWLLVFCLTKIKCFRKC